MVETFDIDGVLLVTPKKIGDGRGFFSETYHKKDLARAGITKDFVQDNHSLSTERGVVRGLHFQTPPHDQDKMVRVVRGRILDVCVDIRKGSPTYGHHIAVELSADNWKQLWISPGFAHGFCTLEPDTEVIYKVTEYYAPSHDFGLTWDDPELAIDWPVTPEEAILSEKDLLHPPLSALESCFFYAGEEVV